MGSEAVRQLTSTVVDFDDPPILAQLMDSPLGEEVKALADEDLFWIYADWEPWVYDAELLWEPPNLTMGEAVHLVADRIQALTTPTDVWPLVVPVSEMEVVS